MIFKEKFMLKINESYTVHPVGQGLFYSGKIDINNKKAKASFQFVFDCGSENKANCIDEVKLYNKEPIDLLVISHFDKDHVNCISALLEDNRKVKRLILPFLKLDERLFLALNQIVLNGYDANNDDYYSIRLIIDPVGTILGNNENKTSVVFTSQATTENFTFEKDDRNLELTEELLNSLNGEISFSFDLETKNLSQKDIEDLGYDSSFNLDNLSKSINPHCKLCINRAPFKIKDFLFYQKNLGNYNKVFHERVVEKFKLNFGLTGKSKIEDYLRVIKRIKSASKIKDIYKAVYDEIKNDIDKKPFNKGDIADLNITSISMYHRSSLSLNRHRFNNQTRLLRKYRTSNHNQIIKFNGKRETQIYNPLHNCFEQQQHHQCPKPNTLLTSDIFLTEPDDIENFYNAFKNFWDEIFLFQIPHHGSKYNINSHLLSILSTNTLLFINYGCNNNHSHPDNEVINVIASTGHSSKIIPVNEYNGHYIVLRSELIIEER